MSIWLCTGCSARYAVGLEQCPQCGDSAHLEEPIPPTAWTCQNPECRAQWRLRLLQCPRCRGKEMRLEEIMPHITVHGGPNIPGEEPAGAAEVPAEVAAPTPADETPPAEAAPAPADTTTRPPVNASKATWIDHVVSHGLDKETAEGMTKPELHAWEPPAAEDSSAHELTITAEAEVTPGEPEAGP